MEKLSIEKLEAIEGGCGCEGAGICCEHVADWAICYGCDGELAYIEPW